MKIHLRDRKVFAVVILLLLFSSPIFATTIRWRWNDVNVAYYRWQLNGTHEDGWTVVDGTSLQADTYRLDPNTVNTFYLQASHDGIDWSLSAVATWGTESSAEEELEYTDTIEGQAKTRKNRISIRASISPYSLDIFDFYKGHDVKGAKAITLTRYSAAADLEFICKTKWPLAFHLDAGYNYGLKKETVLYNAYDLHLVRFGGGLDCVVENEKISFSFGVIGGELITVNAQRWNPGTYLGGRLLLEFNLSDNLLLGCQSKVAVSHQKTSDQMMSSLTWMVDPMALSITYRF